MFFADLNIPAFLGSMLGAGMVLHFLCRELGGLVSGIASMVKAA